MSELEKFFSGLQLQQTRRGVPKKVEKTDFVKSWNLPKNWVSVSIAELLHYAIIIDLKDGNHGESHPKKSDFTRTGKPFITAAQINNSKIQIEHRSALR